MGTAGIGNYFKNKDAVEHTSSTSYDESATVTTSIKVLSSKGKEKKKPKNVPIYIVGRKAKVPLLLL